MKHLFLVWPLALLLALAVPARAQEARSYLTKAEVEQTLIGKTHVFKHITTGNLCVQWTGVASGSGGCNYLVKDGDKLERAGSNNRSARVNAHIEEIE